MAYIWRKEIKAFGVVLILTLVVSFMLLNWGQFTEASDVVNIPDEYLEQAIRNELDKPTGDITVADMEVLTSLIVFEKSIKK